jgi:hypothetical protein
MLQACYTSLPIEAGPAPTAQRVVLSLNDQGRAALSQQLGTAVDKIEGEVLSENSDGYTVSVFHVTQMNGNSATWNGEHVTLAKSQVSGFQLRRLNRTRTVLLAAGVTVGVVALFFGRSLLGFGSSDDTGSTGPGGIK